MPRALVPLAAIRQPAFLYGPDLAVVETNDLAVALAGRSLAGCSTEEVARIFRVLAGEDVLEGPLQITAGDGTPLDVLATASPVRDGDAITGLLVLWQDVTGRSAAERTLAEQHELLERLTETVPVMISIHDPALGRFRLNRAVEEILGYTGEDAADGRLLERTYPDPAYRAAVEAYMRSLEPGWRDMTAIARDGSAVPTSWANFRLSSEVEEVGVGIDLRERTRTEAALRESEAKYRNLVELSPDAILIHQDGGIVFANAAAAALLGAGAPDQLLGRKVLEFVHPGSRANVAANVAADLRGEKSPLTPIEMVRFDGSTVSTQGRGAAIPFGGRPALQVVLRDVTAERAAEDALRESEERLRLAQTCAGVGTWDWAPAAGPDGGRFIRLYDDGFPGARLLDWRSAVHPDDLERMEAGVEASLALGEPFELEVRYDPGDGGSGWMRILGGGVYDDAGELVRVLGVKLDVTAEKEAAAALQESERRHAFLLALGDSLREQSGADALLVVASELIANHLGANAVVYGEVDAAGEVVTVRHGWSDGTVPRPTGSFRLDELGVGDLFRSGQVRESGQGGTPPTGRAAAVYRDLGIRALVAAPVCRGGRLAAVLAVYDLSPRAWTDAEVGLVRQAGDRVWSALARVRAEGALRRRERTLDGIFRAAPVGIGVVSDRVITEANDQLCRMTGYSREELIGHDARLFYPSDEAYDHVGRERYGQILSDGVGAVETQWRQKDGTVRDILLSSSPLDPADPRGNVVFNALDITRLRESERALETYMDNLQRSNEELQRFAYVASHDLQEPLRSIVSFSQLLERRYKGKLGQDADEYIGFITDGGMRMQRLIQDLLQLSRVETRAKPLVSTDAGEVVADALRVMETAIGEAGATVTVGPMPRVMADATQLEQVFVNLVGNALKYRRSDVPPEVRISAERADSFWRFSVADNGIGIEAEYFGRIFVIFQRLHTREEYEGTGIGLAVVKKIVERHGGTVRVDSATGAGSTFVFTLPAA